MQFLAFLSALQAVRQLRLHPLSQLELWVCTNYNIDLAIPYRSLPAIHPLPAALREGNSAKTVKLIYWGFLNGVFFGVCFLVFNFS